MLPGIVNTAADREPALSRAAPRTLREAVVEPFHEFITRSGWRRRCWCSASFFSTSSATAWRPRWRRRFYLDIGFTMSEIGLIAKNAGLWASVFGGLLGGIWMLRIGINRGLWLFGAVQVFSILGFACCDVNQPGPAAAGRRHRARRRSACGLGTAAFHRVHRAHHRPTLHGDTVRAVHEPRRRAAFADQCDDSGGIVDAIGWFRLHLLRMALALPGMALLRARGAVEWPDGPARKRRRRSRHS